VTADCIYSFLEQHQTALIDSTEFDFCSHKSQNKSRNNDSQRILTHAAVEVLATSKVALEALSHRLSVILRPNDVEWSKAVVEKLLSFSSMPEMLKEMVNVLLKLGKQKLNDAADVIEKAAYYLIPAALNEAHVRQLTMIVNAESESFEFQAKTKTLVEIAMARFNGRPMELNETKRASESPPGKLCLVEPPEVGMDDNHAGFIDSFMKKLITVAPVPMEFLSTCKDPAVARAENVIAINTELEILYSADESEFYQFYYVFGYPEDRFGRASRIEVARKLDQMFPRVVFVGLDAEHAPKDEQQIVSWIRRILCRAANIESPIYGQNQAAGDR
jgi:hypothetical protein